LPEDRNDVSLIGVAAGDLVLTSGCALDKHPPSSLRSSNPGNAGETTTR
jgi:hypothetical protein